MKFYRTKYKYLFILLLITGTITSCLEEQDEEFNIIGAVPTVSLTGSTPALIEIGESMEINIRYFSPNVVVTAITIEEVITSFEGNEKFRGSVLNQQLTNFSTLDSYEEALVYTANNAVLDLGDMITLTVSLEAANGLSSSIEVTTTIPDCPSDIQGTFLATTIIESAFDGPYDNTASPYTVTITDNGDGTYDISDLTGGFYGEFYAGIYPDLSGAGVRELSATLTKDGCLVSAEDVPDDSAFVAAFGPNFTNATGVVGKDGSIVIDFSNDIGESGRTTLVKE